MASITGGTAANPVSLTTASAPATGTLIVVSGATGTWAGINGTWQASRTSGTTFTIPVDSSAFGAFGAQTPAWTASLNSTYQIQDTLDWCQTFIKGMPLNVTGWGSQPALTNANIIKQTILGMPFAWRWNRGTVPFTMAASTQDYVVSVPDFGWIEKASLSITVSMTTTVVEIPQIRNILGAALENGRTLSLAAQLDDGAGNITFRAQPASDKIYTATVVYQKKAAVMTTLASTWSPIPDEMAYIYNRGMLALSMMYADDPRFTAENQKFVSLLLAASEGLTDAQKNAFLETWMLQTEIPTARALRVQQGTTARSV